MKPEAISKDLPSLMSEDKQLLPSNVKMKTRGSSKGYILGLAMVRVRVKVTMQMALGFFTNILHQCKYTYASDRLK